MIQVYLITVCSIAVVPPLYLMMRFVYRNLQPRLRTFTLSLKHSRPFSLPSVLGVTWLRLSFAAIYVAINCVALGARVGNELPLTKRSSLVASINLMFVVLGGRTNPWVDFVGVPLQQYQFFHRCAGAIAVTEALLHSGIILKQQGVTNMLGVSGIVATVALSVILLLGVWFTWMPSRHAGRIHLAIHLTATAAWTWHVLLQPIGLAKIIALISCGLWSLTHLYRLGTTFVFQRGYVTIKKCQEYGDAKFLTVSTTSQTRDHLIRAYPGCYYYVFFPGPLPAYDLLRGIPLTLAWAKPEEFGTERVHELSFSLSPHHNRQRRNPIDTKANTGLRLEGPYGRDLRLYEYESVVIAAKGTGITAVLPFVLHLLVRHNRDVESRAAGSSKHTFGDLTRAVRFFWWLEDNSQESPASDQLRVLESLHSEKYPILDVRCKFPSPRVSKYPLFTKRDFKVEDGTTKVNSANNAPANKIENEIDNEIGHVVTIRSALEEEAQYPGRTVLLACGDEMFMSDMREIILETPCSRAVSLAELEYHPTTGERPRRRTETSPNLSAQMHSGGQSVMIRAADPDVEMQTDAVQEPRDGLRTLQKQVAELQLNLDQLKGAVTRDSSESTSEIMAYRRTGPRYYV
ncbi:hypothetical protein B0T14DRAFT_443702 [Immersiella caudata]|uniref:FAD-binding FR-type domain-containing protein n=1 Tax=Immersiella caudata TaxID=314043 RepID=A0AA39XDE7_9PEZI|nr:hypothetical protein B0T14DRAFT_443702 [Immersiella caudata]